MRIEHVSIDGFGPFFNREFGPFDTALTVIAPPSPPFPAYQYRPDDQPGVVATGSFGRWPRSTWSMVRAEKES